MKKVNLITIMILVSLLTFAQPPGSWDRVWEIKSGYFRVLQNEHSGVVDMEGNILIPCMFDQIYDLTDDNYIKVLKNLKIGLYHLEKGIILPAEYDQIWHFEGETAKVMKNKKIGYVNRDGFLVIPVEYNHIWAEEDGLIKVMKDGKIGFLNRDGEIILPVDYQQVWSFEDEIARVLKNGKTGYVDRQGNEVIPTIYDRIFPFENGKAKAVIGNMVYYIDKTGKLTDDPAETLAEQPLKTQPSRTPIVYENNYPDKKVSNKKSNSFKGHLSSVNLGINSYVNENFTEKLPKGYEFMEINYERSWEISVYPLQHSTKLFSSYIGLVTAIGFNFNNYRFSLENSNDLTDKAKLWFPRVENDVEIYKSKLTLLSLNVPLMLEFQIPDATKKRNRCLYLSAGVIGSLKLNTHTKINYYYENDDYKKKYNKDIGINMFRYSYMVRAGYSWLGIYATYSPVSLFKTEKGPQLYPYSVGLSINF
ncbi:MAG: WG repeat-containing protein [Marinilabiliaceae bacterium]|nr:WG repeat-containing protein [Marinilabiliaceae bacterium]